MEQICENAVDLKLKMLRVEYWEQFKELPDYDGFNEVKLLIQKETVC
jgi:hypothetical protein